MNRRMIALFVSVFVVGACGHEAAPVTEQQLPIDGPVVAVESQVIAADVQASGIAQPIAEATLSTKLMATVTAVHVREGDRVSAGQLLAVLDARDLSARGAQVAASVTAAEAMQQQAETQAQRMRALYAQDAAPKAQLDAAETALAQATAAVAGARAGAAELSAVRDYSAIRAPFSGIVTQRFIDPGAFAAPGAPLITVQNDRQLRVEVTAAPAAVRTLQRGSSVAVQVEGARASGTVEGVVPAGGSLYRVNVIVENRSGQFLPGSAASVSLPLGTRTATLIPANALRRQGDLTGVLVSSGDKAELRWVRVGGRIGDQIEIVAGLRAGEKVVVAPQLAGAR